MCYSIYATDNADSLEARRNARAWADADRYFAAGVYAGVEVKPFKKALP